MPTDPAHAAAIDAHNLAAAEHHAAAHYHHEAAMAHELGKHDEAKLHADAAHAKIERTQLRAREAREHSFKVK